MGRLYQVIKLGCIFVAFWAHQAHAEDLRCSLVVKVQSSDGRPVVEVEVLVRESNGRISRKETTQSGVAFCDLGIRPVTVIVGSERCNQVEVKDVPISWEETYRMVVTYDPDACREEAPPPPKPYCRVLFRISDSAGDWVKAASINFSKPEMPAIKTDTFGRALIDLVVGDQAIGIVQGDNLVQKLFKVPCSRDDRLLEVHLVLKGAVKN